MKKSILILIASTAILLTSGCTMYQGKDERFISFFQKTSVEGLKVKDGLTIKKADTAGDVDMVRALYEAGLAAGKKGAGAP